MPRQSDEESAQAVGHNFFEEVPPFENAEELRPLLNRFVENASPMEKFTFQCRTKNRIVPAKIMLVRLGEHASGGGGKTTIVDIRKI